MRAIVQRVTRASVSVGDQLISEIGKGMCVLVGISRDDTSEDADYLVRKILNLRIYDGEDGKRWECNVMDKNYEILCVSQFTLYGVLKGNKPDFHQSMNASVSKPFFDNFLQKLKDNYKPELIKAGAFGQYMSVKIENDGPVTIILESPNKNKPKEQQNCD